MKILQAILLFVTRLFARAGFNPNGVTLLSLSLQILACGLLLVTKNLFVFDVVLSIGLLLDYVDGSLAKLTNSATKSGALFDAVADRIGESALFFALAIHLGFESIFYWLAATSLTISYTRAKATAEGAARSFRWPDLIERDERMVITCLLILAVYVFDEKSAVGQQIALIGFSILLGLNVLTMVQRFFRARRYLNDAQ